MGKERQPRGVWTPADQVLTSRQTGVLSLVSPPRFFRSGSSVSSKGQDAAKCNYSLRLLAENVCCFFSFHSSVCSSFCFYIRSLISVAKSRNGGSNAAGRCPGTAGRNYIRASGSVNTPAARHCSCTTRRRLNEATFKHWLPSQSVSQAGIRIECFLTGCQTWR